MSYINGEQYYNYNKGGHMLRNAASRHAVQMMDELMYALNVEAYMYGIERMTKGGVEIHYYNNNANWIQKFGCGPYNYSYIMTADFLCDKQADPTIQYSHDTMDNGTPTRYIKEALYKKDMIALAHDTGEKTDLGDSVISYQNIDSVVFNSPEMLFMASIRGQDITHGEFKTNVYDEITRQIGEHLYKYRLVSTVDYAGKGGHFVAKLLTKEGWIEVDDISHVDYTKLGKFVQITPNNALGPSWNKSHNILIYERVY